MSGLFTKQNKKQNTKSKKQTMKKKQLNNCFFFHLLHFSETKRFTNVSRISGYTHPLLVVLVTNVNMGILDITCLASKITHVHP